MPRQSRASRPAMPVAIPSTAPISTPQGSLNFWQIHEPSTINHSATPPAHQTSLSSLRAVACRSVRNSLRTSPRAPFSHGRFKRRPPEPPIGGVVLAGLAMVAPIARRHIMARNAPSSARVRLSRPLLPSRYRAPPRRGRSQRTNKSRRYAFVRRRLLTRWRAPGYASPRVA